MRTALGMKVRFIRERREENEEREKKRRYEERK